MHKKAYITKSETLPDKDRSIFFAIIDKMLTTKKFKDFFNNNAA